MVGDPCLPVATHHFAATIRARIGWAKARPWWHWHPGLPACAKAAGIALPLLVIPGAVPIPTQPVLTLPSGPFWASETGGFPGASYGAFGPGAFDVAQAGAAGEAGGYPGGFSGGPGFIGRVPFADVGQVLGQVEQVPNLLAQQPGIPGVLAGPGTGAGPVPMVTVPSVFSPDVPEQQPVPAPDGSWVLLPALVGLTLVRKRSIDKENRHG